MPLKELKTAAARFFSIIILTRQIKSAENYNITTLTVHRDYQLELLERGGNLQINGENQDLWSFAVFSGVTPDSPAPPPTECKDKHVRRTGNSKLTADVSVDSLKGVTLPK